MKNLLFIVNAGKISPNENGGASVYFSHLELLHKAHYNITLLVVEWPTALAYKTEDYDEVLCFVDSIVQLKCASKSPQRGFKRLKNALFFPAVFEYFFLNQTNKEKLRAIAKLHAIDVVWAEWRWAALLAWYSTLKLPLVYAHHDWEYKLARLRSKQNLLKRFHNYQKKRVEFKLVKGVAACISGSFTETKEIHQLSNNPALYLPTTYTSVTTHLIPSKVPNIIHLGGMGTTANRLGLERFLDVCWEDIKAKHPSSRLLVIGSLKQASASLLEKLKDTNIDCLGFVKDLSRVLQPEDIHIIPWEYNTGTRTRVPLALNYQQVLVATKASVEAIPEIKNNQNALLFNDLHEMASGLISLMQNSTLRKELSKVGKATFFNKFTAESQLKNVKNFIDTIEL